MKYTKPPLTVDQQIDILISRGMRVSDRAKTACYLTHVNENRLSEYWCLFEISPKGGKHSFTPGIQFDDVLKLYLFDRKLRLLVLEAIERVEVSLRTRFTNELSAKYGNYAYLEQKIFKADSKGKSKSKWNYKEALKRLQKDVTRSKNPCIRSYVAESTDPPIGAVCELMSFGQLSMWFANIEHRRDRNAIAKVYQLDEEVFVSFIHHLVNIRNLVAHHGRFWNCNITFIMRIPYRPTKIASWFNPHRERKIYNTLVVLCYLLTLMSPGTTWPKRLRQLIIENDLIENDHTFSASRSMGFPADWRSFALWK